MKQKPPFSPPPPEEGALYKTVTVAGHVFALHYGYYEERERGRGEPIPIYPDFTKNPLYTESGEPLVTQMQELCEHGTSKFDDGCCVDCEFFHGCEDLFGICKSINNRRDKNENKN